MMESKHEDGSNKQAGIMEGATRSSEVHPDANHDDNKPTTDGVVSGLEVHPEAKHDDNHEAIIEGENIGSSSSSSSSTSGNPLELTSGEDDPLDDSSFKSDLPQSPISEGASSPDVSAQTPQWSMVSASPRAGPENSFSRELLPPTPEWGMSISSPMKSPLPQVMGRQTGYDPNRIPSSVFSTRPTTPMEWSVASNESLFSIHMGNSSFSKENIFMMGDSKPEECTNNVSEGKSESNNFVTNLPPVFEAASENDKRSVDIRDTSPEIESQKHAPERIPRELVKEKLYVDAQEAHMCTNSSNLSAGKGVTPVDGNRYSVSTPRVSNESGNSSGSFAFPVLDTNEGGKSASLKAIAEKPEEPQSKPHDPQPPPKAACCSWFSCFSSCPRCC